MTTWNDMAPFVAMFAADCPTFTIAEQAQLATVEFFTDSRVWRTTERLQLGATVAGQASYTVSNPADIELVGLPAAWLGDDEIGEALARDAIELATETPGTPKKVLVTSGTTVRLFPVPVLSGVPIWGIAAYAPTQAAVGIEEARWLQYRETIRELTLAKLKQMQGKPWSDPAAAMRHQALYDQRALGNSTDAGPRRRARLRTKPLRF